MSYQPASFLAPPDQALEAAFVDVLREQVAASRNLAEAAHAAGDVEVWRSWVIPATKEAADELERMRWATRMTTLSTKGTP